MLIAFRAELKAAGVAAPSFNDLIVKAAALALRRHPRANGSYRDGGFELHARVNVGIAVAAPDALVVPTVFDADQKSLGAIAAESRRLAERVRDGGITPPELSGATFTVSNLGMYGMTAITPVINAPQAAILGVGAGAPPSLARVARGDRGPPPDDAHAQLRSPDPLRGGRGAVPVGHPRAAGAARAPWSRPAPAARRWVAGNVPAARRQVRR